MIYLFNSGYRLGYQINVLNTIFLPKGATNEYRYRYTGDGAIHIAPDSYNELLGTQVGTEIVVIFIDRFASGGYFFHPIRKGTLVSISPEEPRLFFRTQLFEYLYPKDPIDFNEAIKNRLAKLGLPQLTNADPMETGDGRYAIVSDSIFIDESKFLVGNAAYTQVTGNLQNANAFSTQDENGKTRQTIFVKSRILKDGKEHLPVLRNDIAVFNIAARERYSLALSYCFPVQKTDSTKSALIRTRFGENIQAVSLETKVATYEDRFEIPFAAIVNSVDQDDAIALEYFSLDSSVNLLTHDSAKIISVHIQEQKYFIAKWLGYLLLFAASGVLASLDQDRLSLLNLQLGEGWIVVLNILGFLIQGWIVYLAIRFSGRQLT